VTPIVLINARLPVVVPQRQFIELTLLCGVTNVSELTPKKVGGLAARHVLADKRISLIEIVVVLRVAK
jgi:hypothetical protein